MYIIKNLNEGNYFSFRISEPSFFTDNFEIVSRFESEGEAMKCIENYIDSNEGFERFGMIECEVVNELDITELAVTELSGKFSRLLNDYVSTDELNEITRLNDTPEYAGLCASHNYLDANEVMGEAFKAVFGRDIDLQNPKETELWGAAWDQSKFYLFRNFDYAAE